MEEKKDVAMADFAMFLLGIEQKYKVALDEVLQAVGKFGFSKGKILGYFEVRRFLAGKGLPPEQVNAGMVNRWFPA